MLNTYASMQNIVAERITVVVGLIFDVDRRILIGQRTGPELYKGMWEFPGGKIKPFESDAEALDRELLEEIGISVNRSVSFMSFDYDYPDRSLLLKFRMVDEFEGEPEPCEQQVLKWVEFSRLSEFDMLPPNIIVIEKLQKEFRL